MIRRLLMGALTAALLASVTGCAPQTPKDPYAVPSMKPPGVDVATPELRQQRAKLGIDPCVPGAAEPAPGGLPQLSLPCFGGGDNVDLSTLRGPLVLSFWGGWCAPCRRELPRMQRFYEQAEGKVAVLGVDFQDNIPTEAMGMLAETGTTFPSVADPDGLTNGRSPLPRVRGLPLLILVDADGRIAHEHFGELKSTQEIADLVAKHLGVRL